MTASRRARFGWGLALGLAGFVAAPATALPDAPNAAAPPAAPAAPDVPSTPPAAAPPDEAPPASDALVAPAPGPAAATERPPTVLEALWENGPTAPGASERIAATRAKARELGLANFDAAARALLRDAPSGARLAAARDAASLAPDLPIAQAVYAQALWSEEHAALAAVRALANGVLGLERHLEASLWLRATAFHAAGLTLFFGGLAFVLAVAAQRMRLVAHDLGDRLSLETPLVGRALLFGCVLLAPAAFGAGALGLALGAFALGFAWSDAATRRALVVAALGILLGLHPVLDLAGRAIGALVADPVALAAHAVESETPSPGELARLAQAESDPLAARALAVRARRLGDVAGADARYAALLASGQADASIVNNAANVRLALGDVPGAIALYEEASGRAASPVVLFNLSHAYGAAIEPDLQDQTLARAQALDAETIGALTELMAAEERSLVVDLPHPVPALRARLLGAPANTVVATELRRPLAPGRLGAGAPASALAFTGAAVVGLALARRHPASRRCAKCGVRRCPRCDDPSESRSLCEACARALHRPDAGDPTSRAERRAQLEARRRRAERAALGAALLVPGAAGLLAGRPLLGAIGAWIPVGALLATGVAGETVADPLAAGDAGVAARTAIVALLLAAHAGVVALARAYRSD